MCSESDAARFLEVGTHLNLDSGEYSSVGCVSNTAQAIFDVPESAGG